jgi:hypothetical protein
MGRSTNLDRLFGWTKRGVMPRQIRVDYPGAFYLVMARGDRGEGIFVDDKDREEVLRMDVGTRVCTHS